MDLLTKCQSDFAESKKLLLIESEKDPETEPYRSKYKALDILLNGKNLLSDYLKDHDSTDSVCSDLKIMLDITVGQIGLVYLDIKERSKAEEYLTEYFSSIDDHLNPYYIVMTVNVCIGLGLLWSQKNQPEEAKKWLEKAENLYNDFKNSKKTVRQFVNVPEVDKGDKELEEAYTLTKFYLAQIYGALKEVSKSAVNCHETLKRVLMDKDYDPVDWVLKCATLSQIFMERNLFKEARHHLAAASYVLDTYEESLKDMECSEEEMEVKKEELRHRSADVSRCWAEYGIFLLGQSKKQADSPNEKTDEGLENLCFDSLNVSIYENQIGDSLVATFEDAREIFLTTQKHLNKAKEYYTLEDRASDHVRIVQDHSELFRHLSAFEPDDERQFKMMKKRTEMMEVVLKELNPKYYLDLCRQLWFELGETYHDMLLIKFQKMKDSKKVPSPQTLMKINNLTDRSIAHFSHFLDSLKDQKSKELPDPLPEEILGPALVAHFYLGRLYHKYITPDKLKQVENTTKAYDCFKFLVDVCEKSEKAKSIAGEEYEISKEMMNLLHRKALQL